MTGLAAAGHSPFSDLTVWEWLIAGAAVVAAVWVVWLAVRYTLHPGEAEPDHVKRSILDDDA